MKTNFFKAIASSTAFLRILHDVSVDKVNETVSYVKLGERKTISGEKFYRLKSLINHNKSTDENRYAMSIKDMRTGKTFIVIDRAFYDEF
jgi:hypothetical protein